MKFLSLFTRRAALAVALAFGFSLCVPQADAAAAPGMQDTKAKVVRVVGSASYTIAGSQPQAVKEGDELGAGAVITTGPDSEVILNLGRSGALSIKADSTLSIDKLQIQPAGRETNVQTELEVKKGSVLGNVKKITAVSNYNIKTAKGVAGIRGTVFHVFAIGIFRCASGAVIVTVMDLVNNQVMDTFTVRPGQEINAANNQTPSVQPLARDIMTNLQQEGAIVIGAAGNQGGGVIVGVGTAEQIREAVRNAINNQNQSTTNQERKESD
jgi:hypothetical protein